MKKELGILTFLNEVEEKHVKFEVQMDNKVIECLLKYADREMNKNERRDIFINWAFNDIIKKQLTKEKQNGIKRL